jgi:hypothetical protein
MLPRRAFRSLFASLACGALLGVAGWRGVTYLEQEARPARLLELAERVAPHSPRGSTTVLFVFGPNECPKLMSVIELLNRMGRSRVRIVGALTVEEYRFPGWRELIEAEEIAFPVMRIDPGRVRAALAPLGYGSGPLLLIFDPEGRVIHVSTGLEQPGLAALLARVIEQSTATAARRIRV